MTATPAPTRLEAVLLGRRVPFGPAGELSAIQKTPVSGAVALESTGLRGDEQAEHGHGGPDKALLHYPAEHYQLWRNRHPSFRLTPGGLGENLSTMGMTEGTVCIGDRFRVHLPGQIVADTTKGSGAENRNEVVLELSEPRQPCWKLGHNAGVRELPLLIQQEAATGWYYRVITAGVVAAGATLELISRPHPDWPLERIIRGVYETPPDPEFLSSLISLPELGAGWRALAAKRLETGTVEDWKGRLYGPFATKVQD
ncbi:MAG: MOSC domain-containing protein [Spirochaetaceae bacterium]|nr:MAG: MOSC domain-containing protein [Spirochaetaceae bacterium]